MDLRDEEKKTIEYYDKHADEWSGGHNSDRFWGELFDKFKEFLPQGNVLEIGSGGGRDARELISMGYEYTGTDISEGLLTNARSMLPNAKFLKMSVYNLKFPKNTFDGFWASAILLHIPKDRINDALNKIRSVLKQGGVGFISLKEGQGEKVETETQRLFTYYQSGEFKEILVNIGFKVLYERRKDFPKTKWLAFIVKKIN